MAETGHRTIDDAGVDLLQDVIAEAQFFHRAGAVVLDDDVGLLDQFPEDLLALRVLEVQGAAQLAAIEVRIINTVVVDKGTHLAGIVTALGIFQLDDRSTHIGQDHAAVGTSQNTGQVENDHAIQKTFAHNLFLS